MSTHNYVFTFSLSREGFEVTTSTTPQQTMDIVFARVVKGDPGVGIPTGGTTGQILKKHSNADYDMEWSNTEGTTNWGDITGTLSNQTDLNEALAGKVDKVSGKGLSTNDYSDTEKQKVTDAYNARHSHSNKELLDSYTQTEANIADAVGKKHSHVNKELLDTYTQTEANLADSVSKKHTHSNKELLDTYTQTETNIADAVTKKHTHSNKDILDAIDAAPYAKPDGGIPKSDLASGVQGSLDKADSALQTKADVEAVLTGEISTHTHPHDATKQDKIDAQHKLSYSLISDTPAIPTKTSDLTNDSGFLTSHQDISGKVDKVAGKGLSTNDYTNTDKQKVADAYVKPNGGIPSSDLSSTVQASLGKADTALQEHQDISGKQDKIDASHKLPYSYLSGTPTIPTKTSELTNDSGFLTSHQSLAAYRTSEDQDDIDDGIKDRLNDLEAKTALSDFTDDLGSSPTHTHQTYQDQINALKSIGRFLAIWNCSTGKPLTDPTELPYTYKTGDYYRVGAVSTGTNYKPNGATYTGAASTTVETDDVKTGWVYYYDGTQWKVQSGGATIPVVDVQAEGTSVLNSATGVANVTRSSLGLGNVNNTSDANKPISTATQTALNGKQDTISDLATIRSNAAAGKTASDNLDGHTVAKDVPADAQFTDTIYDDTALAGRVSTIEGKESGWDGKYSKPSGGIPKTDLASGVQESLSKADSALQSYTETDPVFVASAAHGISASDISNWNAKGTYSKPSDGIPSSDMASAVQTSLGKADSALQTKADVEGVLTGEISTLHQHAECVYVL